MDARRSGTVTLVFTDIDGSTRLLDQLGDAYATLLYDHHRLVAAAMEAQGGERVDAAGDGLFFSFPTAKGALVACIEAQRAIAGHQWPQEAEVKVRMGLHTGEPLSATTDWKRRSGDTRSFNRCSPRSRMLTPSGSVGPMRLRAVPEIRICLP